MRTAADIDNLFENRKVKPEQLLDFGFSENDNGYIYSTDILDGQFEMTVNITKEGKVSAEVVDISSKERYVLHRVPDATGSFVGKVREEYTHVLESIAKACFESDVFKSEGARHIIRYIREKYQDEPEFLWERTPKNAIFRRQDNAKWYAALLTVQKRTLGIDEDGDIEIIDLKIKTEAIEALLDGKSYLPAYHMNKKHWITICFDGSVPVEEVFRRIDDSFEFALK